MPDYPYIIQLSKKTEPSINAERNARTRQDKEIINDINENRSPFKGYMFENRVWRNFDFFKSKLEYISSNRFNPDDCRFFWGESDGESQQIDCLFLSKEILFLTECSTNSNVDDKIDSFITDKSKLYENGFSDYFMSEPYNIKHFINLFITDKVLDENQREKLKNSDVIGIDINDLNYLDAIQKSYTKDYNNLAFTNFVCHILKQRIPTSEHVWVKATRYRSPLTEGYCYAFSTNPSKIIDLTTVIHRTQDEGLNETYQRFVKSKKLEGVEDYLSSHDRQFPNNLILSSETLKSSNFKKIDIPRNIYSTNQIDKEALDKSQYGFLKLPNVYGDLHIIDGQHRLFGYSRSSKKDKHFINILLYDKSMQDIEKMRIFQDINENQDGLDVSIVWELYERTLKDETSTESITKMNISKFFNKHIFKEDNYILYHRVKPGTPTDLTQSGVRATLAQICGVSNTYKASGKDIPLFKFLMDDNYFGQKDNEGNLIEVAKLLEDYFIAIKSFNEEEFNLNGDGVILFGSLFVAWFKILYEILVFADQKNQLRAHFKSTRQGRINKFKEILTPFYNDKLSQITTDDHRSDFKSLYYGANQKKLLYLLAGSIRDLDGYDDFAPELVAKGSKEIESILSILNSDHETKDLEIKSNIFKVLPDLTSPESEAHAEEQLESVNMLHNTDGGRVVIGITDDLAIVGCDHEINSLFQGKVSVFKQKLKQKILEMSEGKIRDLKIADFVYDNKTLVIIRVPKIKEVSRAGTNKGMLNVKTIGGEEVRGAPEFVKHVYKKLKDPSNPNIPKSPVFLTRNVKPDGPARKEITLDNQSEIVGDILEYRDSNNYFSIDEYLEEIVRQDITASEFENRGNKIDHK